MNTIAQRDVDVLVLEEATPTSLDKLREAGLDELLPHDRGEPARYARGTMVFSRFPLGPARTLPFGNTGLDVTVRAPQPFRLIAVHTWQPVEWPKDWQGDMRELRTLVGRGHEGRARRSSSATSTPPSTTRRCARCSTRA